MTALLATKTACGSGVRPVRDPTLCGLPFKHPQIWEPFLHHAQIIAITGRSYRIKDTPLAQSSPLPKNRNKTDLTEPAANLE